MGIIILMLILLVIASYFVGAKFGLPVFLSKNDKLEERMDILSLFQEGDIISAYDFNYGYYSNDDGNWIKDYEVVANHPALKQITLKEKHYFTKEARTYSYKNPHFIGIETRNIHVILNRIK